MYAFASNLYGETFFSLRISAKQRNYKDSASASNIIKVIAMEMNSHHHVKIMFLRERT